ncbi:acyltransferase family protein [Cedecea davisae]|uniref:acyltransferase family protein n=1 Tax=Cedecea davisae TaxID=158484 RepID=UPI0027DF0CC4|nr:acyltransferase [Cedecea davisae]
MDGLRGLAVLLVMFFHAGWISGGFVGVDVFCVISGYYMSKMALMQQPFAPIRFMIRRIQRLLPALLCMVITVSALMLWWLLPRDRADIASNGMSALFYLSNFWAHQNVGYFAGQSLAYPFLHTWSLSLEMQFYLLILLLGMAGRRWGTLIAIAVISFAVSQSSWSMGYYGLVDRLWQFALGGIVAWLPLSRLSSKLNSLFYCIATAAIVACALLYNNAFASPSAWSLLPCLAAALILALPNAPVNRLLATLSPLGLISYSLYLWHWPVIVGATYFFEKQITGILMAAALVTSVVLGTLSYLLVERRAPVKLLLSINVLAAAGLFIVSSY